MDRLNRHRLNTLHAMNDGGWDRVGPTKLQPGLIRDD